MASSTVISSDCLAFSGELRGWVNLSAGSVESMTMEKKSVNGPKTSAHACMTVRRMKEKNVDERVDRERQVKDMKYDSCAVLDNKAYSKTLLLPKTTFSPVADPPRTELPFRSRTSEQLYRWQWENAKGPLFVLHDGPPYANGGLHMGHALNKILKDIINRFHLSLGQRVHYVPGWDCHGLPIEYKTLKERRSDASSMSPLEIRAAAHSTAMREIVVQTEGFKQFGIMADWDNSSRTYRTLDHAYEMRQLRIFRAMVALGLVHRTHRPVYFSPSTRTALAEAELVYKDDHASHSVYVTFELAPGQPEWTRGAKLLVWTTTPWTLTANMGIAVHPDLTYVVVKGPSGLWIVGKDRVDALSTTLGHPLQEIHQIPGSELIGLQYRPMFPSANLAEVLNVISAAHVTTEAGTGLVHCAPAHGAEDYAAFQALGLLNTPEDIVCHIDATGRFSTTVPVKSMSGLSVSEGSEVVVDLARANGCLVKDEWIKHRYPYDWRSNKPIIVTATSQWFVDLGHLKENAIEALESVNFIPSHSRNRLEAFVRNRSEWCISRQRVWGMPIPALYHTDADGTETVYMDAALLDHVLAVFDVKGVDYWWKGPALEFVPPHLSSLDGEWRKSEDTMDVWFDSGTSWSMLPPDEQGRVGADVCLEGSDQHRGWFQSQLLTKVATGDPGVPSQPPFKTLITHGMVLDDHGLKMSKSLGNVVDPLTIVQGGKNKALEPAYGADGLRLWVAMVEYWKDMPIGPVILARVNEAMRKFRNSAKFMLGNVRNDNVPHKTGPIKKDQLGLAERFMLHELYNLEQNVLAAYAAYEFPRVIQFLNEFFNTTLSALYFDITKDSLYTDALDSPQRENVISVMEQILKTTTRMLAPVMPHFAENVHQLLNPQSELSIFAEPWTCLSPEFIDPDAASDMRLLLAIRSKVTRLIQEARGNKCVFVLLWSICSTHLSATKGPERSEDSAVVSLLRREESFLKTLFIVSDVSLLDEGSLGTTNPEWLHQRGVSLSNGDVDDLVLRVVPAKASKCPRCWTYTRLHDESLCARCSDVVGAK
ncbi:isoleucyl-tRNA synthetase [Fistulina hepatica ATCC 64428]|uniref:isoleucine--tRNA ligase n=1 Tax=Fistulina hepatica ATCC 64428 TaxID=1128425 RepID=A0A0D7A9I3_9AGAR|nr:isoleucyl-tRNA synthetase [Fistulina hepatica ATCC 64428]